jgi:hypothetical protein
VGDSATKGGSLSPGKRQILDQSGGFSNFFLKLNPFAISGHRQKQKNSIDHSSEESEVQYLEDDDDQIAEAVADDFDYRA